MVRQDGRLILLGVNGM